MHLPGPFRAAVGLVASAADEVKHLPDRAVELPMLAVSTALQMSLRAQQRYARLAARGDQVLNREQAGEEPPQWATFDEPVSAEELRRAALAQLDSLSGGDGSGTSDFFEELFGVDDPGATASAVIENADDGPTATVTPISPATRAPAKKTPARKAAARKTAPRKTAPPKTAPPRTAPPKPAAKAAEKTVNKPRHTAPSKFDDAGDPGPVNNADNAGDD